LLRFEIMPRLLIQLEQGSGASTLPAGVLATLQAAGVADVRASHPELPGLFIAAVPDSVSAEDLAARLQGQPGIRHVEVERLRSTF
jgi:hypothetical protein